MTAPTHLELLEGAAKAAGIDLYVEWDDNGPTGRYRIGSGGDAWNPLTDDGDALRLAVALEIDVCFGVNYVTARGSVQMPTVNNASDPFTATRLAITRAAYEISKEMRCPNA